MSSLDFPISIKDLSFTYRGNVEPTLKHINAQVTSGASIVLMGHGGAGKSTLACSLNGLVPGFFHGQYHGQVLVGGREVARHRVAEMSRLVGFVFQDFEAQLFSTNVELEMAFGPENHCVPRAEIEERITRYLALVGLEKLRQREPATLSGGQKQRLAIGSVLTLETEILVMDEPTTDLDPKAREKVLSIAGHLREMGRTVLIIDHEPETAVDADWVWLMKDGQVVSKGLPSEILKSVSVMESCGVKPHPLVELFELMHWPGTPLTVETAMALIQKNGLIRRKEPFVSPASSAASSGVPLLKAEGLRYLYPTHAVEALGGIDLSIHEGEFVAILGQNGSGKTTLAKHFNGLLRPTSGRVLVLGKPTTEYRHRDLARLVGYVFQNPDHQIFAKNVWEEVGFGLKVLGEPPNVVGTRVSEALENVGLRGYEERVPFTLTKGERQQVAVASVLAAQPRIIILDEPTTGLDYRHQRGLMEMLKRLNRVGHAIIIITHSMWVAAEYATRTVVMKEGSILLDGPTRSVFWNEARLAEASIFPSSLVKLSNELGTQAMTIPRMVEELRKIQNKTNLEDP
jgi:energy-coupling factor transport system ATP-binding protein